MLAIKIFFWALELVFFAGLIGSAVVVLLTGIEDVKEISAKDKKPEIEASVHEERTFLRVPIVRS